MNMCPSLNWADCISSVILGLNRKWGFVFSLNLACKAILFYSWKCSWHSHLLCCSLLESLTDKFWELFISYNRDQYITANFFFLNYFFLTEFHSSHLHRLILFFPIREIVRGVAKKITSTLLPSIYFITGHSINVEGTNGFAPGFATDFI